jgi:hypothetical protein
MHGLDSGLADTVTHLDRVQAFSLANRPLRVRVAWSVSTRRTASYVRVELVVGASVRACALGQAGRQACVRELQDTYAKEYPCAHDATAHACHGTVRGAPQCARYRRACAVSSTSCRDRPTCVYCTRGGLAWPAAALSITNFLLFGRAARLRACGELSVQRQKLKNILFFKKKLATNCLPDSCEINNFCVNFDCVCYMNSG